MKKKVASEDFKYFFKHIFNGYKEEVLFKYVSKYIEKYFKHFLS